ncbi:Potassium transporter [Amanita muscaria]
MSFESNLKRTEVHVSGAALALLTYQTLGIVCPGIGTSPLYVLNGIWPGTGPAPPREDVIGAISAIIWALTLLPLIKYVFISLHFGTGEGEGGTFALYQTLYPPADDDSEADRTLTVDSSYQDKGHSDVHTIFSVGGRQRRIPKTFQWPLLIWCLFGTSLTMADGVFTPAVSVTSAVGGIAVAKPSVNNSVIPISIVFIVLLFIVQQFGTARVSFLFSPVSLLWFIALAATGIYNITSFPGIFRAFDPSRAVLLFVRTRDYDLLTGVLLAITGCEAIFANLGQFNAASLRLSFALVAYPSLLLAYLGQGARLVVDGDNAIKNVFYNTIPGPPNGPLFWIMFVLAILATIVASQTLITATFSLFQQVINMKSFPPLRMLCTSDEFQGQVYIPAVNWSFMILIIVIVAAFANLTNLTNAYGFAVATVMFSTSILLAISMYYVKQWPWIVSILFVIVFGFFDALFWGVAFKKVPQGAWVPLIIGVILVLVMLLWTWARGLEEGFDRANRKNLRHFIQQNKSTESLFTAQDAEKADVVKPEDDHRVIIDSATATSRRVKALSYVTRYRVTEDPNEVLEAKRDLQRIPTCAIFHKFTRGTGVPHTFISFIRQWPALPNVVIFLSICVVPIARVSEDDRYVVRKVRSLEGIYGVTYYLGFREEFSINTDRLAEQLCAAELQTNPDTSKEFLEDIRALVINATHIVPHYHLVSNRVEGGCIPPVVDFVRKWLIEGIYNRLATMFPQTANWMTPAEE